MVPFPHAVLLTSGIAILWGLALAPAHAQIPPGYEVIRLTDDPDMDGDPAINNFGEVVWSKRIDQGFDTEEIFLWDGVRVRRITNDGIRDAFPDINDFGTIVWSREKAPGDTENFEIAMWREGEMTLLTDNELGDWSPSVNNSDHLSWYRKSGRGCSGSHLMFYDGTAISQITDDELGNQGPQINNSDEIAWVAFDHCVNPWMSTIKLFSDEQIIHLTAGDSQDQSPTISDGREVSWRHAYPNPAGLDLWVNGITRRIADSGFVPHINTQRSIAFVRINEDGITPEQWLWSGGQIRQLSDPGIPSARGAINDCGEVAWWFGDFPELDMLLMRMIPGDATHDGAVDANDYIHFAANLTGPRPAPDYCSGLTTDVDRDGDVDLNDFALRQAETGDFEQMRDLIECLSGPIRAEEFCAERSMDIDHDRDIDLRDFASFQTLFRASP